MVTTKLLLFFLSPHLSSLPLSASVTLATLPVAWRNLPSFQFLWRSNYTPFTYWLDRNEVLYPHFFHGPRCICVFCSNEKRRWSRPRSSIRTCGWRKPYWWVSISTRVGKAKFNTNYFRDRRLRWRSEWSKWSTYQSALLMSTRQEHLHPGKKVRFFRDMCLNNRWRQKLNANVNAGHATNNPSVPLTFPSGSDKASEIARIQASIVTLQNLNGPGQGCPAASTTFVAQQAAL